MSKLLCILSLLCANHLQHACANTFDDEISTTLSELSSNLGACADYFQYQLTDGYLNAKLTLPNLKLGDTVRLEFVSLFSRDNSISPFTGLLFPDESSQAVLVRLLKKQAVTYRVDFAPMWKTQYLARVLINGDEFCKTANEVPVARTDFIVEHTLKVVNGVIPVFKENIFLPHYIDTLTCGRFDKEFTSNGATPFVYGGTKTRHGEFPWLVAIFKKDRAGDKFNCGGSLVTTKVILTAAHCFKGFGDLSAAQTFVLLGRYNLNSSTEDSSERREIESITIHPEYRPELIISDADVALLKMMQSVRLSEFIQPICLWNEPSDEALIVGRAAVVIGWGADGKGNRVVNAPQKVKTNIVSEAECLRSSVAFNALTSKRTLCAGNQNDTGPCEGDSGGGLVLYRNKRWLFRGIVSVGLTTDDRCNLLEYSVYCDVAKHLPWLYDNIKQDELPQEGAIKNICGEAGTDNRTAHPWLAAIFRKYLAGEILRCTGALISTRVVLATPSCFDLEYGNLNYYRVYLGRHDLRNTLENSLAERHLENLFFNPKTISGGTQIAILHLDAPVSFTQFIKPICLWTEPAEQSDVIGQSAIMSGWTRWYATTDSMPLLKSAQIVANDQCNSTDTICTTTTEENIGGVLIIKRNERWFLRGMRDTPIYDYSPDFPIRVYHDILKYVSWIESTMYP